MFHGVLLVDKPTGITSHDVVGRLRKSLRMREIGHAGTLDPMATGLLIVLLGQATKLSSFLLNQQKTYLAEVQLGIETDTLDLDGKILKEESVSFTEAQLEAAAYALAGEFDWPVPLFSATRVDGKKLYEYARQGEEVSLPTKLMDFSVLNAKALSSSRIAVELSCSKGGFVRTWASQYGTSLGTCGVLATLRRVASGKLRLAEGATLESIESENIPDLAKSGAFLTMAEALTEFSSCQVLGQDMRLLQNGQISAGLATRLLQQHLLQRQTRVKAVSPSGELVALLEAEPQKGFVLRRVFPLDQDR